MPTYEYACDSCGSEVEVDCHVDRRAEQRCPAPSCDKPLGDPKISGGVSVVFRGLGFHCNEYANENKWDRCVEQMPTKVIGGNVVKDLTDIGSAMHE